MTLPNLRVDQHAQILGYSIIGYGFSFLLNVVAPVFWAREATRPAKAPSIDGEIIDFKLPDAPDYFTPLILVGFLAFAFFGVTGIIIRNAFPNPRMIGVLFAIVSFGLFPLGTLLSIYTLIYVFVIYPGDGDLDTTSTVNLNLND